MLIARPIKTNQETILAREILSQYDIVDGNDRRNIKYIIMTQGEIVGVSRIDLYKDRGVFKYIAIDKDKTKNNLGDALLRSIFNYCLNRNISKVYYEEENSYLMKKGFVKSNNSDFTMEIDLNTFFTEPCKGSKCQASKGMK